MTLALSSLTAFLAAFALAFFATVAALSITFPPVRRGYSAVGKATPKGKRIPPKGGTAASRPRPPDPEPYPLLGNGNCCGMCGATGVQLYAMVISPYDLCITCTRKWKEHLSRSGAHG